MKTRQRWLALGVGLGVTLALASGCNSLIGADAPNLVASFGGSGGTAGADAGTQCLLNSDCQNAEICVFRVCSQQCAEDKDCALGRCLPTANGNACVVPSAAACSTTKDCPDGSDCLRGACRTTCSKAADCLTDQSCILGACVGNDSTHDPSMNGGTGGAGGSSGHGGGTSGSSAGGTAGRANGGEAGAATGGNAGEAGMAGGEGGTAPMCSPGDVSCDGLTPLSCQSGQMKANGANCQYACTNGACTGECKVGDTACDSTTYETCGADNKWAKKSCASVCDAKLGCTGSCVPGTLQCNGLSELDVCSQAGSYTAKQTCTNGECAVVGGTAKCAACGDSDKICPSNCKDSQDVDCPKEPGEACTVSTDCRVGVCGAEHVCCDSACTDSCSSCKIAGKAGACTAIDYSKSSDVSNCGTCHGTCSTNHVTASCASGVCGGACASGYASCNAVSANDGCETNVTNDPNNCNACGTVCKYGECVSGACPSTKWGSTGQKSHEKFGSSGSPVFLVAMPITIPLSGKLAALGVPVYFDTGDVPVHLYVGLFTSSGGGTPAPASLIAQTAELTTVSSALNGPTEGLIAAKPTVAAGSYFIAVISDAPYSVQDEGSTTTTNVWYSSSAPFGPFGQTVPAGLMSAPISVPDFYAVTIP